MKLFENGVGRPSNETIRKRRIFIASIVAMVALILTVGGVLLTNSFNEKELQGAAKNFYFQCPEYSYVNDEFKCWTHDTGVKITVGGAKSLANGYSSSFVTTKNDKEKTIKYASRLFTDYKSQIKKDSKGHKYIIAKITASKKGYKTVSKNVKIYKEDPVIKLTCPGSSDVNAEFMCKVNLSGVKITVGGAKSLEKGYTSSYTTKSGDLTKSIKYASRLFTDYKSQIKKDSKGKYILAKITASKKGYKTVTTHVRIYDDNRLIINCPYQAVTTEEFVCTVNQSGVKITVGGAKSLAKGYTSSFVTTSNDKTKKIKYDPKLFVDYKNLIEDGGDRAPSIDAIITASKKGYDTVTTRVRVFNKLVPITCPEKVSVNQAFKCTTTMEGVTFKVEDVNSLVTGYKSKFITTSNDKTITIKYNSNIFKNNYIYIDKNGKEYVLAGISSIKYPYANGLDYVMVYR